MSTALAQLLAAKRQDIAAAAGRTKDIAKIPDGKSRWRIFPSWRTGADEQFWHDFGQHFVKGLDGKLAAVYICTEKTYGRPCEVCSTIREGMKASTNDAVLDALKEGLSSGKVLCNAVHLDGPKPTEVQILGVPPQSVFGPLIDIFQECLEAGTSLFDRDVIITREGSGKNTKYAVSLAAANKAGFDPKGMKPHDLDAYVKQESQAQMQRALNSVRSVAGLLTNSTARETGLPVAVEEAGGAAIDEYATAPVSPKRAAAKAEATEVEFTDVPDSAAEAAAQVAATKAAVIAAAEAGPAQDAGTGDPDLDAMLEALG
jgi:hypothetical protein